MGIWASRSKLDHYISSSNWTKHYGLSNILCNFDSCNCTSYNFNSYDFDLNNFDSYNFFKNSKNQRGSDLLFFQIKVSYLMIISVEHPPVIIYGNHYFKRLIDKYWMFCYLCPRLRFASELPFLKLLQPKPSKNLTNILYKMSSSIIKQGQQLSIST